MLTLTAKMLVRSLNLDREASLCGSDSLLISPGQISIILDNLYAIVCFLSDHAISAICVQSCRGEIHGENVNLIQPFASAKATFANDCNMNSSQSPKQKVLCTYPIQPD